MPGRYDDVQLVNTVLMNPPVSAIRLPAIALQRVEGLYEQFFRGPLEPPGAADDPRYTPVFVDVVAEATGGGKFTGPYVPLEGHNHEWIQVGWQRQDTGALIRFEAGVAGDSNFKHLYRHVEPPS